MHRNTTSTADLERRLAAANAALSAERARSAALQRQLELRIDGFSVTALFAEPSEFRDEPTVREVRRTAAIVRRDSLPTKVFGAQEGAQS